MKVQEAVENNQDIMDSTEMKAVRNEIMNPEKTLEECSCPI